MRKLWKEIDLDSSLGNIARLSHLSQKRVSNKRQELGREWLSGLTAHPARMRTGGSSKAPV